MHSATANFIFNYFITEIVCTIYYLPSCSFRYGIVVCPNRSTVNHIQIMGTVKTILHKSVDLVSCRVQKTTNVEIISIHINKHKFLISNVSSDLTLLISW